MALGKIIAEIAVRSPDLALEFLSLLTHHSDWDCGMCDNCEFWSRKWCKSNEASLASLEHFRQTKCCMLES